MSAMKILITGSSGFIGSNLRVRLTELPEFEVCALRHEEVDAAPDALFDDCHAIVHMAGVNRPEDVNEFALGNADFTERLCRRLSSANVKPAIIYASSTQVERDNLYGKSKRNAEKLIGELVEQCGGAALVYRLPNVFGKWSRPNYNSAVATFCHNCARGLPIQINDPNAPVTLAYIDDVIDVWIAALRSIRDYAGVQLREVNPVYTVTVGQLADSILSLADSRRTGVVGEVGAGLMRALHATYLSFLPVEAVVYGLKRHEDARGVFVEMLKTPSAGQFSFFTAHPGITRGGHYHHTKSEKFLVLRGRARFRFRNMLNDESYELSVDGAESRVVETVPGWAHDVTNVGMDELVVMLWANEQFDPKRPDTVYSAL
jgi:UDP-2-acetamido-2,6-beta-L-arabino-hexul-4-ose reductase